MVSTPDLVRARAGFKIVCFEVCFPWVNMVATAFRTHWFLDSIVYSCIYDPFCTMTMPNQHTVAAMLLLQLVVVEVSPNILALETAETKL